MPITVIKSSIFFSAWCDLCERLRAESGQLAKTALIRPWADRYRLMKLLLIKQDKRQFRMAVRKMLQVTADVLQVDVQRLRVHMEHSGDVALTIQHALRSTPSLAVAHTCAEVDALLDRFAQGGTLAHQRGLFAELFLQYPSKEVYWVVKLLEKDLRLSVGPKVILDAVGTGAYKQWKACNDLAKVMGQRDAPFKTSTTKPTSHASSGIVLMKAIKPMLCRAVKSIAECLQRCPNGFFAEVKYDGERVQIHKQGSTLTFFSRSLKAVTAYKVDPLRPFLQQALHGDVILDAEVLMMDTVSQRPLPFGTLGKHKREAHTNAVPCLIIFDVLYVDGRSLMACPLPERRAALTSVLTPIPNRVLLSEMVEVKAGDQAELERVFGVAAQHKLEGLVLKDVALPYRPGSRHWLKLKQDHLEGMVDTVDLVVLGAYFGKGRQSGLHAVFLMGCYDAQAKVWKTVCKAGNGFTDEELLALQPALTPSLHAIHGERSQVPSWLRVHNSHVPDTIVRDPDAAPVWEIAGFEFTASPSSTSGWSVRFPRIVRVREDKTAADATNFEQLVALAERSSRPSAAVYPGLAKPTETPSSLTP